MSKAMNIRCMKGSPSKKVHQLGDLKVPEARMNTPCTVAECAQISLAAARDIVQSYTGEVNKLVIQQTVYLEGIKKYLCDKGLMNEEEFSEVLKQVSKDYNAKRDEYIESVLNKDKAEVAEDEANDSESDGSN